VGNWRGDVVCLTTIFNKRDAFAPDVVGGTTS